MPAGDELLHQRPCGIVRHARDGPKGGPHRVLYFWHSVANKSLTLLSNMLTNFNLTDMEVCYKAMHRSVAESLALQSDRFGIEPEITAKLSRGGWRLYEVPVSYAGRLPAGIDRPASDALALARYEPLRGGNGGDAPLRKLRRLLDVTRSAQDAEFTSQIPQILNVEQYLTWNAISWLFGSPDGSAFPGLTWYFDPVSGLLEPIVEGLGGEARHTDVARVDAAELPLSPGLEELAAHLGSQALELALAGGEDYVLLFTLPPTVRPPAALETHRIGEIVAGRRLTLVERGRRVSLAPAGWDHLTWP